PYGEIALIRAAGFQRHLKNSETEIFITLLNAIEKALAEKLEIPRTSEEDEIKKVLPKQYHDLVDVFSEKESDTLPPSRHCDYKIQLE
ncbi:uncharacterized protein BO80DRAFT_313923, partial [Aspergillus ibericus CBS 121593]